MLLEPAQSFRCLYNEVAAVSSLEIRVQFAGQIGRRHKDLVLRNVTRMGANRADERQPDSLIRSPTGNRTG
jgi:hypothetical protein